MKTGAFLTGYQVDARVKGRGEGGSNGFLSEAMFAHPRNKGLLFPLTQGKVGGIKTLCYLVQSNMTV